MKFDINDKVRLTFSAERLQEELFEAIDGSIATVVERYQLPHLPNVDFYEVELDEPVEINGRNQVLFSGLTSEELSAVDQVDEKAKINPKYLTKDAKAMKIEIKKHAHKDSDDKSAYNSHPNGGWKADYDKKGNRYETKTSQHTKKFKEMFGESAIFEAKVDKALADKAEKSGISKGILRKVYNRGLAAWRTGHRPGVSQHQWAMARVNSFATKGKGTWGKADKDLAQKVRSMNESLIVEEWDATRNLFYTTLDWRKTSINLPNTLPPGLIEYLTKNHGYDQAEDQRLIDLGLQPKQRFTIEDISTVTVKIFYSVEPDYNRNGIESISASLNSALIELELEIWDVNDENDPLTTWSLEIEDIEILDRAEVEIGDMPIVPTNLEIDIPADWDSKNFKYTLKMGD